METLNEWLQKEQEAKARVLKTFDDLWETKFGKVAIIALNLFSLALLFGIFYIAWYFVGNWILDLSVIGYSLCFLGVLALFGIFVIPIIHKLKSKEVNFFAKCFAKCFIGLLGVSYFVIIGYGYKIYDKRPFELYHYSYFFFQNQQPNITLGEEWCYFREYKGSICENYITYVEEKKEDMRIKRERKSAEWYRLRQIESKKAQAEAEAKKAKDIEMLRRYENIKRGIQ